MADAIAAPSKTQWQLQSKDKSARISRENKVKGILVKNHNKHYIKINNKQRESPKNNDI